MKLAVSVLSILLLLHLIGEITGYTIKSKRRNFLNRRSESLIDDDDDYYDDDDDDDDYYDDDDDDDNDDDKDFNALLSGFGSKPSGFGNILGDDEKVVEALDLLGLVGQQWFNAYKQRKLEPLTSTLYKMVRTIIVKTNNEDVKKILKADDSILKMLDELNSEKDVLKLFEEILKNPELLIQALEVFNAYLEVYDLANKNNVYEKIEKIFDGALDDERSVEVIQSIADKFINLASVLTADTTISQAKPAILEFSEYLIDTIASGKFGTIFKALYDAAQVVADNIDINDPRVHTFLNEVFKFEKILKESIENVNQSTQRRSFLVRQLLKLR